MRLVFYLAWWAFQLTTSTRAFVVPRTQGAGPHRRIGGRLRVRFPHESSYKASSSEIADILDNAEDNDRLDGTEVVPPFILTRPRWFS